MTVPAYTDIAHFRAPFKNWPYLGMGPSTFRGIGADTGSSPGVPTDPEAAAKVVLDTDSKGVRSFKPQIVDGILMKILENYVIVLLGDDNSVQLADKLPAGEVRESAVAWLKRKVKDGMTVVGGSNAGFQWLFVPVSTQPEIVRVLKAVKGADAEKEATVGIVPFMAVISRPSGFSMASLGGPLGVAAIALLAVGGVVFLARRKKKHHVTATSNPRRRRRHHRR